jgi:hypothetical protein
MRRERRVSHERLCHRVTHLAVFPLPGEIEVDDQSNSS